MKNLVLACVVALASCPMAMAGDIAISTQAGWFSQEAADREAQEIVDNVTAVAVELFAADQQDALADWVVAHTGDGVADLLILCGQFPNSIYPAGNAQPDGSIAELFLDDGNIIVNTGDYMFYVCSAGNNGDAGLGNMMDIDGIGMWDNDDPTVVVTADGLALTPSLAESFYANRPFHLDELEGAWFAELILAQNAAGTRADPVIVANAETGGRLGIFYQTAGKDDEPRGEVISEWINNWYLTAGEVVNPGFPALNPSPADGAVDVVMPLFEWEAGWGAAMHEVYFGDSPDTLTLKTETPALMYFHMDPLVPGQTYYWRVDEVDADANVTEGDVWSFTVTPLEAHFPSPPDGAIFRKLDTQLSWSAGQGATAHDVYFGTDPEALDAVSLGQAETTFAPEGLVPLTTYYWKVDEPGAPGPVWSFSTIDPNGGVVAQYWDNQTFDGAPAVVTTEAEVNFDFNAQRDSSPHPDIPIDHFSCRWTGELQVPVTGTYTLYEASDDGARMFLNGELVAEGWWDRGTTEDTTGPLELVAGERYLLVMEMYENGGGATAYLRWEGPGIAKEIIPQGALQIPEMAFGGVPANGAIDIAADVTLTWLAGKTAVQHDVYMSTDADLVAASDPNVLLGSVEETSIAPAEALLRGVTYYWKVDEVTEDGTVIPGLISSFRVADENTANWQAAAMAAGPDFLATFVDAGVYDIGELGGDITYEFVVRANPDEEEVSMALIGRIGFGDTTAALKYEQWNNTGNYGATEFGVMDYDFGVANAPGEFTHLTFVSSEDAGTTSLYVDGVYQASVDGAITLSGIVGIGYATRDAEGSDFIDPFDGTIFGVAIYNAALSDDDILAHAEAYFSTGPGDVTAPGDVVVGVPNDGDWPGAEAPAMAFDDNVETKFLHRKGGSMATGVQVEPAVGATIVTGLTLTTANDAPSRDPITFELSGSNESIEGPYVLIAAGDVVDFAGAAEWPRFTKNGTAITFENTTAYKYYQIVFPTLRGEAEALMQIAEVELLGEVGFVETFEAYEVGSDLHGQGGWKGWDNSDTAGAPVSDALAFGGSNSVEIIGTADLVHEYDLEGGVWVCSAMQYIPSGTTGTTYFILLNSYDDGANQDWSIQTTFDLAAGTIAYWHGGEAAIVYDEWVELKYVIDLDNNTVDKYYNGEFIVTDQWDDNNHGTIGAIDLFGNGASSVYYDNVVFEREPVPVPLIASVVRSNGDDGDRDPIGAYDGSTAPLPTEEGGLMDGNMVFSDRTYPWAGIPEEYVGSEYIRTFNNDKNGGIDVAYEVTISAPAIVWITVDDRIPAEWDGDGTILSQQDAVDAVTAAFADPGTFVDTGIDIFVREKSDGTGDRAMSVFAAELPAGTYVFGAQPSGKNFYTIGAIPAQ